MIGVSFRPIKRATPLADGLSVRAIVNPIDHHGLKNSAFRRISRPN